MSIENSKRIVVLLGILLVAGVMACKSTKQNLNKPPETPAPSPTPVSQSPFDLVDSKVIEVVSPFDHNRKEHKTKTQDCAACHVRANNDARPSFPGHSACIECHAKDFTNKESKMCIVCHKTPIDAQASRIEFPGRLIQFGLRRFSHRDHADPQKMKDQMDAQKMPEGAPKCDFCHKFDEQGLKASMPKHPECYSCHNHQPTQKFAACDACHIKKQDAMQYGATLGAAFNLYNFRHGPHIRKAACEKCHQTTEVPRDQRRSDVTEINVSRGQRHNSTCWSCHVRAKEPVCSKCHINATPF